MTERERNPTVPQRQIRALYDDDTITVYQAYKPSIADPAVATQKLTASPDFKPGRMTWVKPSWAWMLYRSGYSHKDPGQSRILALKVRHDDFVGLLRRGVLSSHVQTADRAAAVAQKQASTEVRIQWDPERTVWLDKLEHRSIQIGIPGGLSAQWAEEWVVGIEDVTERARELKRVLDSEDGVTVEQLRERGLVPRETELEVPDDVQQRLGMVGG